MPFGDLLKQLRKRAGMTQRDLAAALGYSDSLISSLEKGQRLPDLAAAVELFTQRAQAVAEDFHLSDRNRATVAAICTRLDCCRWRWNYAPRRLNFSRRISCWRNSSNARLIC